MKVREIMTSDVKRCSLDTNLAAAAKIMWEADCGAVPVTDDHGKVVGVITDRDICIAGATRSSAEGEIPVRDVISKSLHACTPGDDVRAAMETMKLQQVRRLPVIGHDGRLVGIISIHDVALQARSGKGAHIPAEDVLETFIAITAPSPAGVPVPV
jgi:CBS domain-containing protein